MSWFVAGLVAVAVSLAVPARPRLTGPRADPTSGRSGPDTSPPGWMLRYRPLWAILAGAAATAFVTGPAGAILGVAAAAVTWVGITRAEPPAVRRRREAVRRDLPHVVALVAAALRGGADPVTALEVVADALPGPATARLREVAARLSLGGDPEQVWLSLADDPALARLGRAMARATASGAPVVRTVERLADELTRSARAEVEDRARAVGVKAALPLGLCLLPAFVLVGIVPLVGGLLGGLGL